MTTKKQTQKKPRTTKPNNTKLATPVQPVHHGTKYLNTAANRNHSIARKPQ